tara:strand:- start:190 stop:546 length:357 start_codon:yes stop_codon:yes gene_type:complete
MHCATEQRAKLESAMLLEHKLKESAKLGKYNEVVSSYETIHRQFIRGKSRNNTMLRESMQEALHLCVYPDFARDNFEDRVKIVAFLLNPGSMASTKLDVQNQRYHRWDQEYEFVDKGL